MSKKTKNAALALLPAAEGGGGAGDTEGLVVKRKGGGAGSGAGAGEGGDDFVTSPVKPGTNAKRPVRGGLGMVEKRGGRLGVLLVLVVVDMVVGVVVVVVIVGGVFAIQSNVVGL